ncbi:MAG: hypothetical protein NVSMB62_16120 [Acidobacteriaceae bacterium]
MPLYEYECTQCKRHTEKIQKFSDPEITACPYCAGLLQRVISAPAIAFKGSGWYKDLYSTPKPAASSSSEGASSDSKSTPSDTAGSTHATPSNGSPAAPAPATTSAPASAPAKTST